MKKKFRNSLLVITVFVFAQACLDEKIELSDLDILQIENEAVTAGYFEDANDMALLAVAAETAALEGRSDITGSVNGTKPVDLRFEKTCVTVTLEMAEDSQSTNPHGYITIDFGEEGCTDTKGNTRKGIIQVEFKGIRFLVGSKIITSFSGYTINDVALAGTHTITNISGSTSGAPRFSIELENGLATWPDETFATREANGIREWIRATKPIDDRWIVTGLAAGTNRNEAFYQVEITSPMVYQRECITGNRIFMGVEGIKLLTLENQSITIDYGTGDCDRLVTVTINGRSRSVIVRS